MITPETDTLKQGFVKFARVYDMPDFVKSADVNLFSEDTLSRLPNEAFADSFHRSYPCHTKAATWLSSAYFIDNMAQIDPRTRERVQSGLDKFATYFGIDNLLAKQIQRKSQIVKQASAMKPASDDCYMIIQGTVKAGLMETPDELEKTASWLMNNRNNLPIEKRAEFADRVLNRSDQLQYAPKCIESLERMTGLGTNSPDSIARGIRVRANLCKEAALRDAMLRLSDTVMQNPIALCDRKWQSIAKSLESFDKAAGLMQKRASGEISYPEDLIYQKTFTGLKKVASNSLHLTSGDVYDLSSLENIKRAGFEDEFGTDLTDACFDGYKFNVKEASAVLPTLPVPEAEKLRSFLHGQGIKPEYQTKSAYAQKIPQVFVEAWG